VPQTLQQAIQLFTDSLLHHGLVHAQHYILLYFGGHVDVFAQPLCKGVVQATLAFLLTCCQQLQHESQALSDSLHNLWLICVSLQYLKQAQQHSTASRHTGLLRVPACTTQHTRFKMTAALVTLSCSSEVQWIVLEPNACGILVIMFDLLSSRLPLHAILDPLLCIILHT